MQAHDHVEIAAAEFLPHGYCYLWNPTLLWTHVTADFLIGAAYVVIAFALAWLVHRVRSDIPFSWVFVAFGLFIVACGLTHFMEIWTLWQPVYWLSGGVKVVTAVASVATAIAMPFTVPPIVATVRDARLAREREVAAARAAALEEQNELLREQAIELEEQNDLLREQAIELEEQREAADDLADRLRVALAEAESARQIAEVANEAKTAFLRTMSHELRTPLNAIIGYEQLLEAGITGPVNAPQTEQLRRIRRSADHLLGLIDEVLTLSRADRAAIEPSTEDVAVRHVVGSALEMIEEEARAKQLAIQLQPVPDVVMVTDPGRLRQVLLNLLTNAIKFTAEGTITVNVEHDTRDDVISFSIRDTGPGIAAEYHEQIFEPFWQVEQTMTRTQGGSGLGLAVSRHLARTLGGDIRVDSAPGQGSVFTLTLSRTPASASRDIGRHA